MNATLVTFWIFFCFYFVKNKAVVSSENVISVEMNVASVNKIMMVETDYTLC